MHIIIILLSRFIVGPNWFPLIGSGFEVLRLVKHFKFYHLMWAELMRRYGPIVGLRLGRDRVVIVSGLDAIREVYSKDQFDGRPDGFFFRIRSFDKRLGVVFTDGAHWDIQRRFSVRTLKALGMGRTGMVNSLEREAEEMIHHLRKLSRTQKVISMHNAFDVSVLNSIWTLIAGKR